MEEEEEEHTPFFLGDDIYDWTVFDVSLFLVHFGLANCVELFVDFGIDGLSLLNILKRPRPIWISLTDFDCKIRSLKAHELDCDALDAHERSSQEKVQEWIVENQEFLTF
jgi:hypothetical protein